MKPRFKAPPICRLDFDIWDVVLSRCAPMRLETISRAQDRRDAKLMYLARLWRRGEMVTDHTYAHNGPRGRFAIDGKRCGGDI